MKINFVLLRPSIHESIHPSIDNHKNQGFTLWRNVQLLRCIVCILGIHSRPFRNWCRLPCVHTLKWRTRLEHPYKSYKSHQSEASLQLEGRVFSWYWIIEWDENTHQVLLGNFSINGSLFPTALASHNSLCSQHGWASEFLSTASQTTLQTLCWNKSGF